MQLRQQRYTGSFWYKQRDIPFHFWACRADETTDIDTIIFLGSGQWGKVAQWVARNAPASTVVVEGLPHKAAEHSGSDLKEFARDYTITALEAIRETFDVKSTNVIAESQAAPGAIWAALKHPLYVQNISLVGPLGFTAHILGDTPEARLRELKRRGIRSALQTSQSPLYDWRNLYLGWLVGQVILLDARWKVSGQKYAVGASHDIRKDCRALANQLRASGKRLSIIVGEHDKLFTPKEITNAIIEADVKHVTITTIKTSHASLAVRDSKRILRKAVAAVR